MIWHPVLNKSVAEAESASQKSCLVTNRSLGDWFFQGYFVQCAFHIKRKSVQRTSPDTQIVHQLQTRGTILCLGTFLPDTISARGRLMGGALSARLLSTLG